MYSVPTAELPGSPQETWTEDGGFEATVTRICSWSLRTALAEEIYGELYPRIPNTLARARSIAIVPFPDTPDIGGAIGDPQHADYSLAKLTIHYQTDGPLEQGGDWFTESIEPTVEFLTLDPADFRWKTSGDPLGEQEAPGMQIRGLDYKLTRYKLSAVPPEVKTLVGSVNNATIACRRLGLEFGPEELLYHPPVIETVVKMDGSHEMKLSMRFTYKPGGWNRFWRKKSQTWERLQIQVAENEWEDYDQYPPADFSPLLGG